MTSKKGTWLLSRMEVFKEFVVLLKKHVEPEKKLYCFLMNTRNIFVRIVCNEVMMISVKMRLPRLDNCSKSTKDYKQKKTI